MLLISPLAIGSGDPVPDPKPSAEVRIVGAAQAGYAAKTSSTATKTDTPLIDTPQAVTVVTRALIDDQAMQSVADAIRYVPGIVTAQGEGNRDAAVFRGNASTSDFYIDGIRDDVQYYRDFYNIDSVEAIKGPNAMIFGRGGSGGVINRVTKQPRWSRVAGASATLGSYGNKRATVDVGGALGEDVAVRINAMAENSGSYRSGVSIKRRGVNPTLALRAGAHTDLVLSYEHFRDDRIADRGVPSFMGRPYETDVSTFFGNQAASPTSIRVHALGAQLEHRFGGGLVLRNRTRVAEYDKVYQNVYAAGAVSPSTGRLAIGAYLDATRRTNLFNQTDLFYRMLTGGVTHTLVAGVEVGRQDTDNARRAGRFATASPTVSAASPLYTDAVSFPVATTNNASVADVASVYVQDQITFNQNWQAILGLRHDRFDVDFRNNLNGSTLSVSDAPWSPRVGLIYKPLSQMSVYASFSRAFVPRAGEQLTSLSVSNSVFDPERFDNTELGVKWDVMPELSATAAVYRLDRTNVVVPGPVAGTSILVDGQRTEGAELGLGGRIAKAWSVMGGYAYQDAKLTASQSATARAGARLAMVPKHTFSLWNRYDLNAQWAGALGVVYRDSIFTSTSNTVTLPSFTRFDAALFYQASPRYRLQLNVENVSDKKYYASAHNDNNITPGAPRTFKLTLNAQL